MCKSFVCLCGGRKSADGPEGHCSVLWQVILLLCQVQVTYSSIVLCHIALYYIAVCYFSSVLDTALVLQCLYFSIPGTIVCTQSCWRWWRFGPLLHQAWYKIPLTFTTIIKHQLHMKWENEKKIQIDKVHHMNYLSIWILTNMYLDNVEIRFGIGRFTTEAEVEYTADKCIEHVSRLREMRYVIHHQIS